MNYVMSATQVSDLTEIAYGGVLWTLHFQRIDSALECTAFAPGGEIGLKFRLPASATIQDLHSALRHEADHYKQSILLLINDFSIDED